MVWFGLAPTRKTCVCWLLVHFVQQHFVGPSWFDGWCGADLFVSRDGSTASVAMDVPAGAALRIAFALSLRSLLEPTGEITGER